MATVSATYVRLGSSSLQLNRRPGQVAGSMSSLRLVPKGTVKNSCFPSLRSSRLQICCAAKKETVNKVVEIVRKQLALAADAVLTPESKFSDLGADSLDTVEIVMGLEEEFGISVEEESSQNINTVQDAADLIEELVEKKAESAERV